MVHTLYRLHLSTHCWFTFPPILCLLTFPLFFVQVQVDDQVVLESMKSPGSFLHVSKPLLGHGSVYSKRSVMIQQQ